MACGSSSKPTVETLLDSIDPAKRETTTPAAETQMLKSFYAVDDCQVLNQLWPDR